MADSNGTDSNTRQKLNQEDLALFLKLLSPDPEASGRRYTSLHQKLTAFFTMKGVSDPISAADETIDRAVSKIGGGAVVPDVDKYCLGIARNLAKERYRASGRENSAFREFIQDLSHSCAEQVERIYKILKPCFEQLAIEEQQLLLAYCQKAMDRARSEQRRELAETMNITAQALRVRVTRLRARLTDCVRNRSNGSETATSSS